MRLPRFSLHRPSTIDEAAGLLGEIADSRVLAGGTDLVVNMKHRVELPSALISLDRVADLDGIREEGGAWVIGARATLKQIQYDTGLAKRYPALVEAARHVGSFRHQTMGTLGGNLCQNTRCRFFNQPWQWRQARSLCHKAGGDRCHVMNKDGVCYATYSGDLAPALLVLDAAVRAHGPKGAREFPLADLYSGEGRTPVALGPGEVLTAVSLPASSANGRSRYEKHSLRGAIDFPVVGCAVWHGDEGVRAAFTAVDRRPVRAAAVEDALTGRSLTPEAIAEATTLARKASTPAKTTLHPVAHKRELMEALFARAAGSLV